MTVGPAYRALPLPFDVLLQHENECSTTCSVLYFVLMQHNGFAAELERPQLSSSDQEQLSQLVAGNGLYRLRLPSALSDSSRGAPFVSTSFPARCLSEAAAKEGLALDMLDDQHIASVALNAPCGQGAAAAGSVQLPTRQEIHVRTPVDAPNVLQLVLSGQQPGSAAAAVGLPGLGDAAAPEQQQGPQRQSGQGQDQAGQQGGANDKAGERGKPKEEEKTWLQKNWMVVMPLGFIVSCSSCKAQVFGLLYGAWRASCGAPGLHKWHAAILNSAVQLMNLLGGGHQPQRAARGAAGGAAVRAVPARR
jgi:hypothetical protein